MSKKNQDLSKLTYYKCNKKDHFANKYFKP